MSEIFERRASINRLFSGVLTTLVALGILGVSTVRAQESKSDDALRNLLSFEDLQETFESDSGKVRLVTLLSPT